MFQDRAPLFLWLVVLACDAAAPTASPEPTAPTPPAATPLPPEAVEARTALSHALELRDPDIVSQKARAAAAWEGTDRELDLLLADAFANVLMRPEEARPILARWPAEGDLVYRNIAIGAAIRSSDWAGLEALVPGLPVTNPARDQLVIRALQDPRFDLAYFERALHACALLDRQPGVGRRAVDLPVPETIVESLTAWGATRVAVGRGELESDPDPERGRDPIACARKRWLDVTRLPSFGNRPITLAVSDGRADVYVEIESKDIGHWSMSASEPVVAGRLLDAARLYDEAGGGEAGLTAMRTHHGDRLDLSRLATP